jgi:NAD kinase
VLVPICPSAPPTPSLVVPSGKDAEVRVGKPGGEALIVIDGESERELGIGEAVRISISTEPAKFLYWKNFYQKLGEKLL